MKYDFDSYLLYEVTSSSLYTAKAVVELNIPVHGEILREAAQKAFRRFPYYSRTVRSRPKRQLFLTRRRFPKKR